MIDYHLTHDPNGFDPAILERMARAFTRSRLKRTHPAADPNQAWLENLVDRDWRGYVPEMIAIMTELADRCGGGR
jgi:hypothetical protein